MRPIAAYTLICSAGAVAAIAACSPRPFADARAAEPADPLPVVRVEPVPTPSVAPAPRLQTPELFVDKVNDAGIGAAVSAELGRDPALAMAPVEIDCVGGRVALRGSVPDPDARTRAEQIAARVEGVRTVENVLEVALAEGAMR